MAIKRCTIRLLVLLALLMLAGFAVYFNAEYLNKRLTTDLRGTIDDPKTTVQKNDDGLVGNRLVTLSLQLSAIHRRLQQLVCLSRPASGTSETGGWCDDAIGKEHRTDHGLARSLSILMFGRTVASLGDGLGDYGQAITETGLVERVDSFDGAPFVEEATGGRVRFFDLAVPQFWLSVYDWAICLEVLEHVPARYEAVALDNLVRPARLGVVLSWARPGQGGFVHVNPRPVDYVVEAMRHRGFRLDDVWTTKLRNAATFAWFKFTINVYRRTNESMKLFV